MLCEICETGPAQKGDVICTRCADMIDQEAVELEQAYLMDQVRQLIIDEMTKRNMRRAHLCERVEGVSRAMIYRFLDGDTDMSIDRVNKCLNVFGYELRAMKIVAKKGHKK